MVVDTTVGSALAARVGARIKRLRKLQQLNQEQLAQRAGYDRGSIAAFETGRALPSVTKLVDLAAALGVAPSLLLDEAVPAPPAGPAGWVPLPTWSATERRQMLHCLRHLMAELEAHEPPA